MVKVGGWRFALQRSTAKGTRWQTVASGDEREIIMKMYRDQERIVITGGWRVVDQATDTVLCAVERRE